MYNSVIKDLNAVFKIVSLIIFSLLLIFLSNLAEYLLVISLLSTLFCFAKIRIKKFMMVANSFLGVIIFTLIFSLIFDFSLIWKLIFWLFYLLLIDFSTSNREMVYGIEKVLWVINKKTEVSKIALYVTLILKFPIYYSRTYDDLVFRKGYFFKNFFLKIKGSIVLLPQVFKLTKVKMKHIIDVYDLRLYNYFYTRTYYKMVKWKITTSILMLFYVIMLGIVVMK